MSKSLKMGSGLLNLIYPVGSIYISVNSTSPHDLFGGEWELFSPGRTLVCIDTNDSDFNTVKKIGGSKYLQQHSHWQSLKDSGSRTGVAAYEWHLSNTGRWYDGSDLAGNVADSWKTGNSGNLQPYVTCYFWERIS